MASPSPFPSPASAEPEFISSGTLKEPFGAARALVAELAELCSGGASASPQDRVAYSRDMWPKATLWAMQGKIPRPPDAVCWPSNAAEVAEVVRYARRQKLALIPFGAGSGVCGGAIALRGGVAVDLKRMERLIEVDRPALQIRAEAGIIGEVLERRLATHGVTLGHFPSSIYCSTLGGWLAARSAGQLSTKYGKIEDMVLEATAVMGTGEVVTARARPSAGPDLLQLLVGSEGTLGLITESRLFAAPQPARRGYRAIRFRTLEQGAEAIRRTLREGIRPAVVRLYDPFDTLIAGKGKSQEIDSERPKRDLIAEVQDRLPKLANLAVRAAFGRPAALNRMADLLRECLLILVFEGDEDLVAAEEEQAREICRELSGVDLGPEPARHWMENRYSVSYKQSKVFDAGGFADTMEVATTWEHVIDVYRAVRQAVAPLGFIMAHLSHAYLEGCSLYFTFSSSAATPEATALRYDEVWAAALGAARHAGATVSHHHGIGFSKAEALKQELGEPGMELLHRVKSTFDPDGILNPGKLGL